MYFKKLLWSAVPVPVGAPTVASLSGSECFDDLTTEGASCCFSMQGDDVPAKLPVKLHEVKQGSGHDADLTGAECSVSAPP